LVNCVELFPKEIVMAGLVVSDLCKGFSLGGERLEVLRGLSLTMHPGDSVAIVGPSGCGKSTLLHILGTLDQPNSGRVEIDGNDPFSLTESELAAFRSKHIGFIFQDHYLLPQLTVLENVLVPALAHGSASEADREHAKDLLQRVELADRLAHLPSELSGGQRERVAIARSLFGNPSLLLADEPTGNLDRRTAEIITKLLLDLQKETGAMLIAVTHSESLAQAMGRRAELIDGQLV
jgi:lipoprotein-releasing system ATP-binding protein